MAQEIILAPLGGLNQDDSLITPPSGQSAFDQGDYRYSRNLRIGSSDEDNTGGAEILPSTLEISDLYEWNGSAWVIGSALTGTSKSIGEREDHDEGAVYYAVYNSNGDHCILKFVKSERKIYQLLKWSGLNFALTNIVSLSRVSQYLVITCRGDGDDGNVNPPRVINTTTIADLKFTLGADFSEYHISFAKWPPLAPPYIECITPVSPGNKMLQIGLFQYCYRYVYYGGLRSTWGPSSPFITIENAEDSNIFNATEFKIIIPGFIYDYETQSYFKHDEAEFYEVVEFIEFAFRQSTTDSWKLFKRMPTGNFGDDSKFILFDNKGASTTVSRQETEQYFDVVPLASGACEVIDNRVMFGDNDDDFEIEDFEVEDVEVYEANNPTWNGSISAASFSGLSGAYQAILNARVEPFQYNFKMRGVYKLGILFHHWAGRTGLVQSPDNWTYLIEETANTMSQTSEALRALGFNIPAQIKPPIWAVGYQIVRSNCLNIDYFIWGVANDYTYLGVDTTAINPLVTPQGAQTIINDYNDNIANQGADNIPLAQRLSTYYRNEVFVATLALASRIYIDIRNFYLDSDATGGASKPSNNVFYSFQKGDRVRFRGSENALYVSLTVFDVEIVDFDGRGIIINKPATLVTLKRRADAGGSEPVFGIEIYRPKPFTKTDGTVRPIEFFEMGEWYPVTNATTPSRDFEKRDFRWTSAASVVATPSSLSTGINFAWFSKFPIACGDVHWLTKTFYYNKTASYSGALSAKFTQMNQDKNNAAGFWEHNEGRAFVGYRYPPVQIRKTGQARFGLKFLEDSIFIAINTFLDGNQFIYPSEYGTIRSMRNTSNAQVESVGNVLLINGEIESWSVYVNRTTLEELGGRTQLALSDQVLGSFNTLLGSHGTLNPESVSARNGRVIWWNAKKGVWVRYGRDGLTEISNIKMKNWFKDIGDLIIDEYSTATPPKVISVFDNYHEEWIGRIDHSSLPATFREYESYKCLSFSERNIPDGGKRWKSALDYAPDLFASLDNEVYSLIGTKVHIHEEGVDYGLIYGTPQPVQIEFATGSRTVKDWRAVQLIASDKWSFERIRGDWKSNAATIQESRLPLAALEKFEGPIYWSEIKRDKNSPNAGSEQAGVIDGNPMKGLTLRLLLQLDPDVDYLSVLNWLTVLWDPSPKNTKN